MMLRTARTAALGALVAFPLGLPGACAVAQDQVLSFEPGEYEARVRDVRVDVVGARYAERQLTVDCAIANGSDTPITVDRKGVLLDDDGLEIPPVAATGVPRELVIPAGESSMMRLEFAIGGLEPHMRTLGLWAIRSPRAVLPPVRVKVPGIQHQSE